MKCQNCGREYTGNFCPNCGRSNNPSIVKSQKSKTRVIVGFFLIIAFSIIATIAFLIYWGTEYDREINKYLEVNDVEGAIAYVEENLNPESYSYYSRKADIYEHVKDYDSAAIVIMDYCSICELADVDTSVTDRLMKYKPLVCEDTASKIESLNTQIVEARSVREALEGEAELAEAEQNKAEAAKAENEQTKADAETDKAETENAKAETEAIMINCLDEIYVNDDVFYKDRTYAFNAYYESSRYVYTGKDKDRYVYNFRIPEGVAEHAGYQIIDNTPNHSLGNLLDSLDEHSNKLFMLTGKYKDFEISTSFDVAYDYWIYKFEITDAKQINQETEKDESAETHDNEEVVTDDEDYQYLSPDSSEWRNLSKGDKVAFTGVVMDIWKYSSIKHNDLCYVTIRVEDDSISSTGNL